MNFSFTTQPATFLERPNRYRIVAQLHEDNTIINAHCPDPGRLRELLIPGVKVHVSQASHSNRKTAYDLRFVEHPEHGQLVSLDTRQPNQIFQEGLETDFFAPFRGYQTMQREVTLPISRRRQAYIVVLTTAWSMPLVTPAGSKSSLPAWSRIAVRSSPTHPPNAGDAMYWNSPN